MNLWIVLGIIVSIPVLIWLFPKLKYRFKDLKKYINSRLTNPVKDHEHSIDNAKKKVAYTRGEVIEAIVANEKIKLKKADAETNIDKYSMLSSNAAKAKDEEAVEKFVKEKHRSEAKSKTFSSQVASNDKVIDDVKRQIVDSDDEIEDAEVNKEILEVQLSCTRLRRDMIKTKVGITDCGLGNLGSLKKHVDDELIRTGAYEEVYVGETVDLEKKYSADNNKVKEEVEELLSIHKGE